MSTIFYFAVFEKSREVGADRVWFLLPPSTPSLRCYPSRSLFLFSPQLLGSNPHWMQALKLGTNPMMLLLFNMSTSIHNTRFNLLTLASVRPCGLGLRVSVPPVSPIGARKSIESAQGESFVSSLQILTHWA